MIVTPNTEIRGLYGLPVRQIVGYIYIRTTYKFIEPYALYISTKGFYL